jgi:hypothetical protein
MIISLQCYATPLVAGALAEGGGLGRSNAIVAAADGTVTVDGVELVAASGSVAPGGGGNGIDFRLDAGAVSVDQFAEKFCSGIPKEFGVDTLGRSLLILPNSDPEVFETTNTAWAEHLFKVLDHYVGNGSGCAGIIRFLLQKPFLMDPRYVCSMLMRGLVGK